MVGLAPVCLVQVPGLGDYLNHLARMHVLVSIAHSAFLQRYYQVHWTPIPYLAMDAVVPLFARVLPIYLAGKIFVLGCIVLPVIGAACVHYAVHRRVSAVPLAAWLFSSNTLLAYGFLNYLFALGLALILFAGWLATGDWPRWRRAAIFAAPVLALYFGHAFACGAYCLAVAGVESGRAVSARFRDKRVIALDMLAAFAQAIPALVFAATLNVNAGYVGSLRTHWGDLGAKLVALVSPILFLHDATNVYVVLAAAVGICLLAARVRIDRRILAAGIPVALGAIAMPHVLASTWGMDLRLPLFLVLLLIGGASFPRAAASWRRPALAALLIMLAAKSADAWMVLRQLDSQIAETRQVLGALPLGARLLVVNVTGHGTGRERVPNSTIWHMPLTAVIDRDAFVPYLFNGLTTIRMRPEFRLSSTPNGLPVTPDQLGQGMQEGPDTEQGDGEGARLYWLGWPDNFDYVLVQRFGADPGKLPENLHLLAHAADMDLYRIVR